MTRSRTSHGNNGSPAISSPTGAEAGARVFVTDMRSCFVTVGDLRLDEDDLHILDHNHLEAVGTDYILVEQICYCTVVVVVDTERDTVDM